MRMAIFTLGTRGDVQPYVALGKAAIDRGHDVIICTGKSFQTLIEANGITFAPAASDLMAMLETKAGQMVFNHALRHPIQTKRYLDTVVNPAFRQTLDQFYAVAQSADVLLYHPKAFGTPDIAKSLGIPCISVPPVPITYPIAEFPNLAIMAKGSLGGYLNKLTYSLLAQAESASLKEVNDFRKMTLGVPKRKSGQYTFTIDGQVIPILYPVSPALFPDVHSWKGHVFVPGFFSLPEAMETLSPEITAFLAAGPPPIVVSFSSMPLKNPEQFTTKLLQAVAKTGDRLLIITGASGMQAIASETCLVVPSAPHQLVFPQAKLLVHHGGVGTLAQALQSGKPQVIMPFGVDQPFWAHRLMKLGYAPQPLNQSKVTVEQLVACFQACEQPIWRQKAQEIKQLLAQEQGTTVALEYIEAYVQNFN